VKLVDDLNLKDIVTCYKLGLADYSGSAQLSIGLINGLASISDSVAPNYGTTFERVDISRLDDLGMPKADLIKMDVEGVEAQFLKGGEQYFLQAKPAVIFENWLFNEDLKKTYEPMEILKSWGYDFFLPCWTNPEKSQFSSMPLRESSSQVLALCPFKIEERSQLDERLNILAVPSGRWLALTDQIPWSEL
jgi:FkbM family methyltransferase